MKFYFFIRRIIDTIIALIALIILSPVLLIVSIAICLESKGGAIFKQKRIGLNGKPYDMYKFRSMVKNAQNMGTGVYSFAGDPRITRVGHFIRRTSIDELPQLWNIFTGDMAFIGPRPEREHYIKMILEKDPRYVCLYQIRPGITSMATLYNGYTDSLEKMLKRLEMDLDYLEHRSWWLDAKILGLTFLKIMFGKKI